MSISSSDISAISKLCSRCYTNVSMKDHTSFRIGGTAQVVVFPQSLEEFISVLHWHEQKKNDLPLCVLGKGSNVLFDDLGFDGMVVITTDMKGISISQPNQDDRYTVTAECGVSLTALARICGGHSPALAGLSFAYGIPGSVGGAVVMNAGAYGGEMSDVLVSVDYFDTQTRTVQTASRQDLELSYRHSIFQDHDGYIVLSATLELPVGDASAIQAEMKKNMASRKEKQPLELPNAGSVFKRPKDAFVGKMIEDCGLKGYTIGGAQISTKHAGFIVNIGDATSADVLSLIEHIQSVILETYGISLVPEIKYIPHSTDKR